MNGIDKRFFIRAIVIFMVVMLFCTFVSGRIEYAMLPEVSTVAAASGNLMKMMETRAKIYYDEEVLYSAPTKTVVTEVYVKQGERVEKKTPLMRLDVEKLVSQSERLGLEISSLELQAEELEFQLAQPDNASVDLVNSLTRMREKLGVNTLRLEKAERELSRLESGDEAYQDFIYDYERAKMQMESALENYEANKVLFDAGTISESALEQSRSNYEMLKLEFDRLTQRNEYTTENNEKNRLLEIEAKRIEIMGITADINANTSDIAVLTDKMRKDTAAFGYRQDEIALQEKKLAILDKQKELIETEAIIDQNGVITATDGGVVTKINAVANQEVSVDAMLAAVCVIPGKAHAELTLSRDRSIFEIGDKINLYGVAVYGYDNYGVRNETTSDLELLITAKNLIESNNNMVYRAAVDESEIELAVIHGQELDVEIISGSKIKYDYILPKSTVVSAYDRGGYVFIIQERDKFFGSEYFIQRASVEIIDYDDVNVAVQAAYLDKQRIVAASSKPLEEGMTVRTWDNLE